MDCIISERFVEYEICLFCDEYVMYDGLLPYLSTIKLCEIEWASWFSGIATSVVAYFAYRQSRNIQLYEHLRELDSLFKPVKDELFKFHSIYDVHTIEDFFDYYGNIQLNLDSLENYLDMMSISKKFRLLILDIKDIFDELKMLNSKIKVKKFEWKCHKDNNLIQLNNLIEILDRINELSSELSIKKQNLYYAIYRKMGVKL